MIFESNKKYTLIGVSGMACTTISRFTVTEIVMDKPVVKFQGQRKKYYLKPLKDDQLVFEGWELPFTTNTEAPAVNGVKSFSMNACINLVGDETIIKDYVDNRNLNEKFTRKGIIVLVEANNPDSEKVLYPFEGAMEHHAVIQRILERSGQMQVISDLGDTVLCDYCNDDFTDSDESGGFIFSSSAVCPHCAEETLANAKKYNEESFIKARCPENMSFKEFVMKIRGGDNTIKVVGF